MKRSILVIVTAMTALTFSSGWRSQEHMEKELIAVEKSFSDAIMSNDVNAVERFLDPDWVVIDPDGGVLQRARFLDVIRTGALKHDSMDSEDIRVRIYGEAAVVTALTSTKGTFMDHGFTTKERATDVFIRRNGQWICVLSQLTRFSKKDV